MQQKDTNPPGQSKEPFFSPKRLATDCVMDVMALVTVPASPKCILCTTFALNTCDFPAGAAKAYFVYDLF